MLTMLLAIYWAHAFLIKEAKSKVATKHSCHLAKKDTIAFVQRRVATNKPAIKPKWIGNMLYIDES